jgi:hypothetical protein
VSERLADAEFVPVLLPAVFLLSELVAALVVEPEIVPAVPVPPEFSVADDDTEDDEVDGLGHKLLYTNCSGVPLQVVTDSALNVPFA